MKFKLTLTNGLTTEIGPFESEEAAKLFIYNGSAVAFPTESGETTRIDPSTVVSIEPIT